MGKFLRVEILAEGLTLLLRPSSAPPGGAGTLLYVLLRYA